MLICLVFQARQVAMLMYLVPTFVLQLVAGPDIS